MHSHNKIIMLNPWDSRKYNNYENSLEYIVVTAIFQDKDFKFDRDKMKWILKEDAHPYKWRLGRNLFESIEELIVHLQMNYVNDESIVLDMREQDAKTFKEVWRVASEDV